MLRKLPTTCHHIVCECARDDVIDVLHRRQQPQFSLRKRIEKRTTFIPVCVIVWFQLYNLRLSIKILNIFVVSSVVSVIKLITRQCLTNGVTAMIALHHHYAIICGWNSTAEEVEFFRFENDTGRETRYRILHSVNRFIRHDKPLS